MTHFRQLKINDQLKYFNYDVKVVFDYFGENIAEFKFKEIDTFESKNF